MAQFRFSLGSAKKPRTTTNDPKIETRCCWELTLGGEESCLDVEYAAYGFDCGTYDMLSYCHHFVVSHAAPSAPKFPLPIKPQIAGCPAPCAHLGVVVKAI